MNLQRRQASAATAAAAASTYYHQIFILLVLVLVQICSSAVYSPSGGPVYINPNAAPVEQNVQPTKVVAAKDVGNLLVTQTVYGFLDFTTTIGNTIMVFSPNSAPPPEPPKVAATTTAEPPIINTVIETKPPATEDIYTISPTTEIKPSKAIKTQEPKPVAVSSVVQIVESSPEENIIIAKAAPSSKVQIISSLVEVISNDKPIQTVEIPSSIVQTIVSKVEVIEEKSILAKPPVIISSVVEVKEEVAQTQVVTAQKPIVQKDTKPIILSSIVEVHSSDDDDIGEPVLQVENNIGEPEYDFLSRQPSEFAEETYRIHNIKPSNSKNSQKTRQTETPRKQNQNKNDAHPTGLVTKLGGTVVKDGATTVHETSVIGTYISGKYAQVLQSTSHIFQNSKPKISPSSSLRILKTAAPHVPKNKNVIVEPTPARATTGLDSDSLEELYGNSPSPNLVRSSRRPATSSGSFKNRFRNRNSKDDNDYQEVREETVAPVTPVPYGNGKKPRPQSNKAKNVELATVSVFSEPATPAYPTRRTNKNARNGFKPAPVSQQPANDNAYTRRFKPKLQASPVDSDHQTSSLYKFKLNRAPGRWQYKTSPKPRVTIRKQNADDLQVPSATPSYEAPQSENDIPIARSDDIDLDSSSSINGDVLNDDETLDNAIENKKLPVETLKVEISTPVSFKDTYYEIATIKSPYTFQVGSVKNTRYITVTSTFEKTLDPEPTSTSILTEPLTENILATTAHIDKEHNLLDSSIATLPPILLSSDAETPPLETLTETFSTTQIMLKTHILPVLREGGNATSYTLTQTYHITRLVTATKTLPPMEAYQFNPSKALKEFNSKLDEAGSELNLELDFGDDNENDEDDTLRELPADLDLSNIGLDFDLSEVDKTNIPEAHLRPKKKINKSEVQQQQLQQQQQQQQMQNLSPEQLQQLAILRLLNPAGQIPQQYVQSSQPVLKYETVYESHVIPIFNGVSTSFSTISRPVATVTKTDYEIVTSAVIQPPPLQQLPIPPPQPQLNPLYPQQQQFQITTAPIVQQTMVTQTKSKILKLTFGAKTAYTTLFSTTVVPTILTTFITQSVQVQPTAAAFPGYFPAPYAPFPYVG